MLAHLFFQIILVTLYVVNGSWQPSTYPDSDDLAHSALQRVPVEHLGQDVQLRCTKIFERSESDMEMTSRQCDPSWSDGCFHMWLKDGEKIDTENWKYDTKSIITYDYCENFEWTTDLIKGFGPIVEMNSGDKNYYASREMACYASSLTIKSVVAADFGKYTCNFSHHTVDEDGYYNNGGSSLQYITLYNVNDTSIKQDTKIEYFQKFYTKGLKDKMLLQCVATGGELQWSTGIYPESGSGVPLAELNSQDIWRCFNYSENRHSPHKGITESFVYVDRICALDSGRTISCIVGGNGLGQVKGNVAYIRKKSGYDDYYYEYPYWEREPSMAIAGFTVVPVVVALLIASLIFAAVRAKLCECCSRSSVNPRMVQFQPQVPAQPNQVYPAQPVQAQVPYPAQQVQAQVPYPAQQVQL
ncbi:uncharacterized protein LOC134824230 [Bolinopsis microptera]|uniref:uncharacterized protein LOC134824230 n=1 Tax=Bolinopsis microptera TaxID=2820187 RepID=UPI0030794711